MLYERQVKDTYIKMKFALLKKVHNLSIHENIIVIHNYQ
jgi:hypothetical protein